MNKDTKRIFILGIKGVAMANLAVIFQKMGKKVTGSDTEEEQITDDLLRKYKIKYTFGFDPKNVSEKTDIVIYSAAHGGTNNPQVIEAKKRNIKVISQAEILGELCKIFKTSIAVTGCHGKTTTSSLLSYALLKLKTKLTYLVGAPSFTDYDGGDYLGNEYFVFEADEYGVNPPIDKTPKLHYFHPTYILCPNIDFDHPDIYENLEMTKQTFLKFFDNKKLVLCADDANTVSLLSKLKREQYVTYGFSEKADYQIKNYISDKNGIRFEIFQNDKIGTFSIKLFGEKNALNTAGVIVQLLQLGFPVREIKNAIHNFYGVKRRFELVYSDGHTLLLDDYAHHPEEIKAVISAARSRFPNKRIVVIFHPHTYSRTQIFLKEFAEALSFADISLILPIFSSAREKKEEFHISSFDIAKQGKQGNIQAFDSFEDLRNALPTVVKPGDLIFTMGAGDVYKLKDDIIRTIAQNSNVILRQAQDDTEQSRSIKSQK
jgi:UDP-N-acetylmuramate--alanine ligase